MLELILDCKRSVFLDVEDVAVMATCSNSLSSPIRSAPGGLLPSLPATGTPCRDSFFLREPFATALPPPRQPIQQRIGEYKPPLPETVPETTILTKSAPAQPPKRRKTNESINTPQKRVSMRRRLVKLCVFRSLLRSPRKRRLDRLPASATRETLTDGLGPS